MEHPPSHPQSFEDKPFRLALSDLLTYCTPSASSRKYNLVQLVLYAADAVVLYYYVATTVYPVPGGILNSDDGWWTEYALFTFTFGFIIGFRAVLGMATFFHSLLAPWRLVEYYELCRRSNAYFYAVFTPLYLLFTTLGTIVPFFGASRVVTRRLFLSARMGPRLRPVSHVRNLGHKPRHDI
ncbi:hypothetical protein PsYK624_117520 [Phanerochaete sordida]|uniref:Uncharacterized protein n=1 Tax=Phanerochaete sordida TaxID=48140 RepID=A0A9P3GIT8_9APHY|nr:hypothetical protein PsYK624_117520 [Phanerochaete sordida]